MSRPLSFYLRIFSVFIPLFLIHLPMRMGAEPMKLLASGTGWVENGNALYATSDGGATWTDITPVPPGVPRGGVALHSTFLLNAATGWAVISNPEIAPGATLTEYLRPKTVYRIARTSDGGRSWSFSPFYHPELEQWQAEGLAGAGSISFVGNLHGWMDVIFAGNFKSGKLLATEDGGATWKWVNGPGAGGAVHFVTLQDGWLIGAYEQRLYATHDGSRTWQEVRITPPAQIQAGMTVTFQGTPTFADSEHGFVAALYVGTPGTPPRFVVYSTPDGGRTWSPVKILGLTEEVGAGAYIPFAITDAALMVPMAPGEVSRNVTSVPLNGDLLSDKAIPIGNPMQFSFADQHHGIQIGGDGRLLSTSDGGATWKDATPWHMMKTSQAPLKTEHKRHGSSC
jgi:photosystem II stability/assembly factor-like uncharacterized protein